MYNPSQNNTTESWEEICVSMSVCMAVHVDVSNFLEQPATVTLQLLWPCDCEEERKSGAYLLVHLSPFSSLLFSRFRFQFHPPWSMHDLSQSKQYPTGSPKFWHANFTFFLLHFHNNDNNNTNTNTNTNTYLVRPVVLCPLPSALCPLLVLSW